MTRFQPEDARNLEKAWIRDRALATVPLDAVSESAFGYAIRLASLCNVYPANGAPVAVASRLDDYRDRLLSLMRELAKTPWHYPETDAWHGIGTIAWQGAWHTASLKAAVPRVTALLREGLDAVAALCDPERDLRTKKLVLALGGGGGTGFAHLCLFQWLEELDIRPALITGTSSGAIFGFVRALQDRYDAAMTTLKLPGFWGIARHAMPCFGTGKHGLMGMCRVDFTDLLFAAAHTFGYDAPPGFHELRIPFACISSGILRKDDLSRQIEVNGNNPLRALFALTRITWNKTMLHAASLARLILSSDAVCPVTFGFDDLTRTMTAADAVSFSMLVPGVFNFELPANRYRSREILDAIFRRDQLYRLCDGGLASNVPMRAAKAEVMRGRIGQENAYFLGIDVFAPQKTDGIFYPLQQIANINALEDARHADAFVRLQYLLAPVNLFPSLSKLRWLNTHFRRTFADEMRIVQCATKPLQPLDRVLARD